MSYQKTDIVESSVVIVVIVAAIVAIVIVITGVFNKSTSVPIKSPGSVVVAPETNDKENKGKEEEKKGLTTGQIVLIVIGCAIVVLLVAGTIKHKMKKPAEEEIKSRTTKRIKQFDDMMKDIGYKIENETRQIVIKDFDTMSEKKFIQNMKEYRKTANKNMPSSKTPADSEHYSMMSDLRTKHGKIASKPIEKLLDTFVKKHFTDDPIGQFEAMRDIGLYNKQSGKFHRDMALLDYVGEWTKSIEEVEKSYEHPK